MMKTVRSTRETTGYIIVGEIDGKIQFHCKTGVWVDDFSHPHITVYNKKFSSVVGMSDITSLDPTARWARCTRRVVHTYEFEVIDETE